VTYVAFDPVKGRGNTLRTIQNPTAEFLGVALSPEGGLQRREGRR